MQVQIPSISQGHEFNAFVRELHSTHQHYYPYSLETYLRSLFALVLRHQQNTQFTYEFIAELFVSAFSHPPMPFDETWHAFIEPPIALLYGRDDTLPPLAVLRELLLYQISDLRLMEAQGDLDIEPGDLFLGLQSPTGNRWNNVQLDQFLLGCCGALADGADISEAGWEDLAILLWMGQMHT